MSLRFALDFQQQCSRIVQCVRVLSVVPHRVQGITQDPGLRSHKGDTADRIHCRLAQHFLMLRAACSLAAASHIIQIIT